jgi:hypothetical protein
MWMCPLSFEEEKRHSQTLVWGTRKPFEQSRDKRIPKDGKPF